MIFYDRAVSKQGTALLLDFFLLEQWPFFRNLHYTIKQIHLGL